MPPSFVQPWQSLFAPDPAAETVTVPYRVVSKRGRPWLLLPASPRLARQALTLYPAQSFKARLAKAALGCSLQLGIFPGTQPVSLRLSTRAPFVEFLQVTAGTKTVPFLAGLAGNPAAPGQRQVLLLFDDPGASRSVVKTGRGGPATELICREVAALRSLPAGTPGAPQIRAEFEYHDLRAFALDFCPGAAPSAADLFAPRQLLTAWLQPPREVRLMELPALTRLAGRGTNDPWFAPLRSAVVRPALMHGDFAPWNVKVSPRTGTWTALDWERGERDGVPAWDWFHFVIQPALLVQRLAPEAIAARLQTFLASAPFQTYAAAARIAGLESALLAAYLAYSARVIQPAEGLAATEQLLAIVAGQMTRR